MRDDELFLQVDYDEVKKILSSDKFCQKLLDFENNLSDFDEFCTREEYIESIDFYAFEIVKKLSRSYSVHNIELLTRYFKYFVKDRYDSFLDYFSNPVINNIHTIKRGSLSKEELDFYSARNSAEYLSMLDKLKEYYEEIIEENYDIDYGTFLDIFIFFGSGKLDDSSITRLHCDYIFSKLLDDKFINEEFPKEGFVFYFKRLTELIAKENKLACTCEVDSIPINKDTKVLGRYVYPPINKIYLNKDFISNKMNNNLYIFRTIFHELQHCHFFTKRKPSYFMLKMTKDTILHEFLGDEYYNVNYKHLSFETEAEINAYIKSLKYIKQINMDYYNSIISSTIREVFEMRKASRTNVRYKNSYPYHLDQLFETALNSEQKKLFMQKYPILEYEYYKDGKRKLPIDLLVAKHQLKKGDSTENDITIKMCSLLLTNQIFSAEELLSIYSNSSVFLDNIDLEFEKQRLKLLGHSCLEKLKLVFNSINPDDIKDLETKIVDVFMNNILFLNSSLNDNLDEDKINYLNLRLQNDVCIFDAIIKNFKNYNKNKGIELDFDDFKTDDMKKGL